MNQDLYEDEECPPTQRSPQAAHHALPDMIGRVATMISYEQSKEEIRDLLVNQAGMSESDAYLTFIAGRMIQTDRQSF